MTSESLSEARPTLGRERIIIVLTSLELGGSERQALLLARYLRDVQKADVQVWGFQSPGRAAELCDIHRMPWRIVPLSWSVWPHRRLKSLARFAWELRKARPTVILSYTMLPNVVCGLVWRLTGAQLCVWNQRDEGIARIECGAERRAVLRTTLFISNSRNGARFLVQSLGVKPELVRVVHNGVELAQPELDRRQWRERLDLSEDCFVACMVANLHVDKDHATLLRAWRLVVDTLDKKGRPAVLLLAGRFDTTHTQLQSLCHNLKLESEVKFLGSVKDVPGLLQAADLSVFSSRSEGCPNGVLESMAAGLAVAGTDIPGIRDAVGADEQAFLAPPGDAATLANCIITLALEPELRTRLGKTNLKRIEAEFTPRKMCEEMVTLITDGKAKASISPYHGAHLVWALRLLPEGLFDYSFVRALGLARRQLGKRLGWCIH